MLLLFLPFLCLLAWALPTKEHKHYYPWNPVTWTIAPTQIPAGETLNLSWKGGSGDGYEVYYVPQWTGQRETYEVVEIASTGATSVKWKTPDVSVYPAGTTLILGVKDVTEGHGAVWYDLTGRLPFVEASQRGKKH